MFKKLFTVFMLVMFSLCAIGLAQAPAVDSKDTRIEKSRHSYMEFIKANPNYFGTIIGSNAKPVLPMKYNTKYEELLCLGLHPDTDLLEAVFKVKLSYGFNTGPCGSGSKEYIAFYVDYGAGFVSAGPAAQVKVHNFAAADDKPIFYAAKQGISPEYLNCTTPQIVKVRAILSWQSAPTGPNYIPVWGNVIERWVQIKPKLSLQAIFQPAFINKPAIASLPKFAKELKIAADSEQLMIMGTVQEIKSYIANLAAAEAETGKAGEVEKERSEFKALISQNPNYFGAVTKSTKPEEIMKAVDLLPVAAKQYVFIPGINIGDLFPVFPMSGNTAYEELKCVGLFPEEDLLEAVIEIKKPCGYNGNLCGKGSEEYVTFYIDWGTGYDLVDTTSVRVHDIPGTNDKHLYYAVRLRIDDIQDKLKACEEENVVKVKAILSWNTNPEPFGETHTPAWGNVLVRDIQIRPGSGTHVKPEIKTVNNIHTDHIADSGGSKGLALKAGHTGFPLIFDRPFGGLIACFGNVNVGSAHYYRFLYKKDGTGSWMPVTDVRRTAKSLVIPPIWQPYKDVSPDANGWFSIQDYLDDLNYYPLSALIYWNSAGKEGLYELKLELADSSKNTIMGMGDEVDIVLDNTAPALYSFLGMPPDFPVVGVAVKDSAGKFMKCETFCGSNPIKVYGNFADDYFNAYSLNVFGGNLSYSGYTFNTGRYDAASPGLCSTGTIGAAANTDGQEIYSLDLSTVPQTPKKVKCAYGIRLNVSDRAIVGYYYGSYEYRTTYHNVHSYVTFDWDPSCLVVIK